MSCGRDKTIKQFKFGGSSGEWHSKPVNEWSGALPFTGIDHHWKDEMFATSSGQLDVWSYHRTTPIHSFKWGSATIMTLRFCPADANLLASAATDCTTALYDLRSASPLSKVVMRTKTNGIAWNPREPMYFTMASDDHNLYTFDSRKLTKAVLVHKDFTGPVMDVAYSPTGREFVAGAYDKTVRIFPTKKGRSREVYHAKRMQRIFCVKFSADAQYVMCGSDDMNIRLWKANASKKLGKLMPRERRKLEYLDKLKARYANVPELRRIAKHRHVPKHIHTARKRKHEASEKERRKESNRVKNKDPSAGKKKQKKEAIVTVLE